MYITEEKEIFLIEPRGEWTFEKIMEALHADPQGIVKDYLEIVFNAFSDPSDRDAAFLAQEPKCDPAWVEAAIKYYHGGEAFVRIKSDILSLGKK